MSKVMKQLENQKHQKIRNFVDKVIERNNDLRKTIGTAKTIKYKSIAKVQIPTSAKNIH